MGMNIKGAFKDSMGEYTKASLSLVHLRDEGTNGLCHRRATCH